LVLEAVLTALGEPTVDWASALKAMRDPDNFIERLSGFDMENVKKSTVKKLRQYTD